MRKYHGERMIHRWPRLPLLLLAWLTLALGSACSDGGTDRSEDTPAPEASATPAATPTQAPPPEPLRSLRIERVFPALSFAKMTGIYEAPDGSSRLFVVEQAGRILVFDNRPDVQEARVFLDIRERVLTAGAEEGLLGLAVAPDFASSGQFYVYYSTPNPRRTVLSRFRVGDARNGVADAASEERILEIGQPFANHNGGGILFGPDGHLYLGIGDGGSAGDPMGNGQNLGTLLGKMLRIDVSGSDGSRPYRIPPDNPFVGRQGAREEVWTYGMRNPWRFAFDPETKVLWAADVGQNQWEEIDIIARGANYGWNITEGRHCFPPARTDCVLSGITLPVFEYDHSGGECSITGGFVYRGGLLPSMRGAYVYGDYCTGRAWALRYDGSRVTEQALIVDTNLSISAFGQDRGGNVYLLDHGPAGGIYRLVP